MSIMFGIGCPMKAILLYHKIMGMSRQGGITGNEHGTQVTVPVRL
jgi:hypothetical protein